VTLETQAAFSRRIGKNKSHVTRLKHAGRLVMKGRKVDVEKSLQRIEATESPEPHHQANIAAQAEKRSEQNKNNTPESKNASSADHDSIENIGKALKMETYRLQKAKAEKAAMEADKLAGNLVDRKDVEFVLKDFGSTLGGLLTSLPDRLAGEMASLGGDVHKIHKAMEEATHELQQELSAHMKRKAEQML